MEDLPLLENDLDAPGVVAPGAMRTRGEIPPDVVLCFFGEVVDAVGRRCDARLAATLTTEAARTPVWVIEESGVPVAVTNPGIGGPLAAALLEELIVLGGRRFVACGGAGALVDDLVLGHAVVVDSAVRDEGTSFHYLSPSRTVEALRSGVDGLVAACGRLGVSHTVGRTRTTDAVYRETRARVDRRRAEGCLTVEMEAASLLAVAAFRGVAMGQILLAGDSLAGETWDDRGWMTAREARATVFDVARSAATATADVGSTE